MEELCKLTYIYSDEQQGFTDSWKYVSPDTPAPNNITEWVRRMYIIILGLSMQYRNKDGPRLIEVGLRPASGIYHCS